MGWEMNYFKNVGDTEARSLFHITLKKIFITTQK